MNATLARLRLRWFLARRALGYGEDFTRIVYRIYLGHDKIIHFRDGLPVYSLTTPAAYSRPAANFLARTLYRSIQGRNLPNMLSFAVNDVCNAACEHCSFFAAVEEPGRHVLSLGEARQAIRAAEELGVSLFNLVGGEPLMRDDLPAIVRAIDKDLAGSVVFTNGWHLAERAAELRRAGLDGVFVSLDAADAGRHDAFRRKPGLFDRALDGLQTARAQGLTTGISATLTPETFAAGELPRLVELARRVGAHEVLIFDAMPTGRYQARADLVDNPDWVERMIQSAAPYHRDGRYPGVTFFPYMTSHRSVGCACGTSYCYLSPYGDVMSCDFNHVKFGNVLDEPLWRIWERLSTAPDYCQAKWGGCKIKTGELRASGAVAPRAERLRPGVSIANGRAHASENGEAQRTPP